jgi:hypothetical protein
MAGDEPAREGYFWRPPAGPDPPSPSLRDEISAEAKPSGFLNRR